LAAVEDADPQVRAASLFALGEVAKLDDVPLLITRVVDPPHLEDRSIALKALQAACIRMPDREACADQLGAALGKAPASAQDAILETLAAMGGPSALQTVAAAAQSDDPKLQDTATRLLGSWMTADVGPVLLKLAQQPDSPHKVRSLRGFIRVARQFVVPDQQRAEMCRDAWEVAERDEERKLVLEVMQRYPSLNMLRVAVKASKHPALKDEASAVAYSLAQKLSRGHDAQELLEQIQLKPISIEIVKATYGAGGKQKDVTAILQQHAQGFPLIVLPSASYNTAFRGDPVQGVPKTLRVEYRMDGKSGEAEFSENATILLPVPK
jgi:hypothetical protein